MTTTKDLPHDLTAAEARALAADDRYWHARTHGTPSELHRASVTRAVCIWHAAATSDRIDDLIRHEETQEP